MLSLLLASAVAHPHHGGSLRQQYRQDVAKNVHFTPRSRTLATPEQVQRDANADLFLPPLPGQSSVDFHPVLRTPPGPNDPLVYYSWHIHVYFYHENANYTARAMALRTSFIREFNVSACPESCFMGGIFDNCTGICAWDPVYGVDGPHPYGQWGIYLPNELLAATMSWLTLNHGEFIVLFHPNTGEMIGDHAPQGRAMWIRGEVPLDLNFLVWLQCQWFPTSAECRSPPQLC